MFGNARYAGPELRIGTPKQQRAQYLAQTLKNMKSPEKEPSPLSGELEEPATKQSMTTEELNKIDTSRHLLPEPAPEVVGQLIEQLRGYDKHLRVCMGWTQRASELEVSSGMRNAQLSDLKKAESFLPNA